MKYFSLTEFDCSHTGENNMSPEFLQKLDLLRDICGFPFVITSGYRSPEHPVEARKPSPGTHAKGIAADIACNSSERRGAIVKNAIGLGFMGIGVAKDFIHVDTRESDSLILWTYQ